MQVREYPDRFTKYAEVTCGNKHAIVWREGIISLYVDGVFDRSRPLKQGQSLKDGVAIAKGACKTEGDQRHAS